MKNNNLFGLNLPDKIFGLDKNFLILFVPPLILLIIIFLSINLIIISRIDSIKDINKKIESIRINTKKINEQNKYLMSIDQKELKKEADYLNSAVLKDKRSYVILGVVRNIASKFNYQIESFSLTPGEVKDDTFIKITESNQAVKMPVSLSLIGPKSNSLDLILSLEKTLPILFIDKFETKTSGELTQLNLNISSYYVADNLETGSDLLTLNDLILTDKELALIDKISSFSWSGANMEIGLTEMQKYSRENPFSL